MPDTSEERIIRPKHLGRSKEYYCFHRDRWQQEKVENITKAIRWMERYAMFRFRKSSGAPISLNQSAMAAAAKKIYKKKDGSIVRCQGPGLRTIQRSWRVFMTYMSRRGYEFRRAHSKGVGIDGKRPPRAERRRKLGWIAYSVEWRDAGNQLLRFMSTSGSALSSRWIRDECLQLVPQKGNSDPVHSAKLTGIDLSSGEQRENFKHNTSRMAISDPEVRLSVEFRQKYKPWRLRGGVLRRIWAIARKYLGAEGDPVAHRVIDLWRAGFDGRRLVTMLERAVGWPRHLA